MLLCAVEASEASLSLALCPTYLGFALCTLLFSNYKTCFQTIYLIRVHQTFT